MNLQKKSNPWKRATISSPEAGHGGCARMIPKATRLRAGCLVADATLRIGALILALWAMLGHGAGSDAEADTASAQLVAYRTGLYTEAQSAFRRNDYEAAAALYARAEAAGYDDPVVFYNMGVTSFRLGRFEEAEAAFATAAAHQALAPLAYYNLGLVARRQDDHRDARGWFRQAAVHPEASPRLKGLARKALDSLPVNRREKPALYATQETRLRDFLRFAFDTGYGQDSNAYRAPDTPHVDPTRAGSPTVTPLVQSGSFVPIDADLEFRWAPYEHGHFSLNYAFDGKIFTSEELENANAFRNELSLGGRVRIPKENGYQFFRSRFAVTRMDENYYDRTDGGDVFIGTTDISDRFKRTRFGPDVYYHRERGRLGWGFNAEAFINKYFNDFEEDLDHLDLTHEQYRLGAHLTYDLLKRTTLKVGYNRYRRDYTQRKAKTASGTRLTGNDELRYDYHDGRIGIRQLLGRHLDVSLAYQYTIREDAYEGYDDYDRHSGLAELALRTRRLTAEAGLVFRTYDFPNAFAFDLPAEGGKSLERLYAYFEASYRIRQRYQIMVSAELDGVDSSDPRSAYDRNQFSVGMRWSL